MSDIIPFDFETNAARVVMRERDPRASRAVSEPICGDARSRNIIMLMGDRDRPIQAVIELGRVVRADRQRQERNLLKSLYIAKPDGIASRVKGDLLELLLGSVT